MSQITLDVLTEQLELADTLRERRADMLEPQDLPGRYGRVVAGVDRVLDAIGCESVLAGGWAVWRHGFLARVTQDIDVVLPRDRIEEFLQVSAVSGFDVLQVPPGRWPKAMHRETGIQLDILPEGARPGIPSRLAPTTIPAPSTIGADGHYLRYITLEAIVELKLAAGRPRDKFDVMELVRANETAVDAIRSHLSNVHADYVTAFDHLVEEAGQPDAAGMDE